MRLDLTSLSFNSDLNEGVGTPSWGTSLGQSEGYNISVEGANDILLGMFNNKINESELQHNLRGEKDILLASCFNSVWVNGVKIDKPFILAVVEEHSQSHDGRKSLKYNDKFKYLKGNKIISNEDFYIEVQSKFGKNACWFAYELNIVNGTNLIINAIKVSEKPVIYDDSKTRRDIWLNLIGQVSKIDNNQPRDLTKRVIIRNKIIGQFVFDILEYLKSKDQLIKLQDLISINSDKRFGSISKGDVKLTSMFWIFNELATDEQLTQGGKIRAFNTYSFELDNLKYYLSKEWTDQVGHRLDINNFTLIFNSLYSEFQISKINEEYCLCLNSADFNINLFHEYCINSGLIFSNQLIQRFVASLCTKPFVICSGLSGSGKTKLAQAFAQWISYDNSQYLIVPVGADWTNREPLLGYPNALDKGEYVSPESGVLELMLKAKLNYENNEEPTKPYFLILDEMNLSHVERYFADFLSTMESGENIPLHKIDNDIYEIPKSIKLPRNLFIIGTVNIDETTYMFSPKVLDRANTIEFRLTENDIENFIANDIKLDMDKLTSKGINMSESFLSMALKESNRNLKPIENDLKLFFSELKKSGAEFGYRTANEIGKLMIILEELGEKGDNLLDIAIMQKLLPKLHGSRNKLTKVLPVLGSFCLINNSNIKESYLDRFVNNNISEEQLKLDDNIKYKISFEKICRMYKNALENGFASYAEA